MMHAISDQSSMSIEAVFWILITVSILGLVYVVVRVMHEVAEGKRRDRAVARQSNRNLMKEKMMADRTLEDVDWSLRRCSQRIATYDERKGTRDVEIERGVVNRLLDERLTLMTPPPAGPKPETPPTQETGPEGPQRAEPCSA